MDRNFRSEAVVLKSYPLSENHKGVVLLTPEKGVLRAVVFGAASSKSKIKSVTRPFVRGEVCLYYDPVKESYRVKDFSEADLFEGLSSNLDKFYRASLWCEILLKCSVEGDSRGVFMLLSRFLELLNRAPTKEYIEKVGIQFLWRFLMEEGSQPDLTVCDHCHEDVSFEDEMFFSSRGLFCSKCMSSKDFALSRDVRFYLSESSELTVGNSLRLPLSESSLAVIKKYLFNLITDYVPGRLKTPEAGAPFL